MSTPLPGTVPPPRRPRGRPTPTASKAREQDLLSVAAKLFERDGFAGVSISELARATGISRTTIHARYRSKAELFTAICSYACRVPSDAFRAVETAGRQPCDVLNDFASATQIGLVNQQAIDFLRLCIFEARRFPDLAAAVLKESRQAYAPLADYLATLLAEGVIEGDPLVLADHFIDLVTGGYRMMLTPANTVPLDMAPQEGLNLFLTGVHLI